MSRTRKHDYQTCSACPHTGQACDPGHAMMAEMTRAMDHFAQVVPDSFEMSGHTQVTTCGRACVLAWLCARDVCALFGDVDENADANALLAALGSEPSRRSERSVIVTRVGAVRPT